MVIEGLRGICVEAEDETSQMIYTDNLKNAFTWKLRRVYSSHSVYSLAFNHFKAYFPSIFFLFPLIPFLKCLFGALKQPSNFLVQIILLNIIFMSGFLI